MLKDKLVRTILFVGFTVSAVFYLLAFVLSSYTVAFILFGFVAFMITALSAQTLYTWRKFMEEEKSRLASMKPCIHCEKPIYEEDEICPYCHKRQTNETANEK
ncbi:MAG: hypothetical protein ACQEQA_04195 [Bacillota bacterium]